MYIPPVKSAAQSAGLKGSHMLFGTPGIAAQAGGKVNPNALKWGPFQTSMKGKGLSPAAMSKAYQAQKVTAAIPATAAKKGLLARAGAGLIGGPVGWALTAWTVYELMKMGGLLQTGGYVPQMAGGGNMSANRPYLVGEQGPELFMPGSSGQLLNNGQTNNLLGGPVVLKNVTIGVDSFGGLV